MRWPDSGGTSPEFNDKSIVSLGQLANELKVEKLLLFMPATKTQPSPTLFTTELFEPEDCLEANREGGSNEQRHARAILIFLFTYWEDEIRPRLALAKASSVNEIRSDIMGDMRILRHAILHARSVLKPEEHGRLKVVGSMFPAGEVIFVPYDDMHKLFVLIKQDCARLMFDWLGVEDAPISPEEIVSLSIQRGGV